MPEITSAMVEERARKMYTEHVLAEDAHNLFVKGWSELPEGNPTRETWMTAARRKLEAEDPDSYQSKRAKSNPPLHAGRVRAISKLHQTFLERALEHISAGSPAHGGLNDSFMARCALLELRDYINHVLGECKC